MFTYNVNANADNQIFKNACSKLESAFPFLVKKPILVDVDGSMIQNYFKGEEKVSIFNDYEVDAVYVDSDLDLGSVFN